MRGWLMVGLCVAAVGCTSTTERAWHTEAGWEVTRIEQNPDPLRMSSLVLSKYLCSGELPEAVEGRSRYTGCVPTMPPQAYVGEGWLTGFVKTGMIASSVWAAGHEIGNMSPDQTTINQVVKQSQRQAVPRGRH
jgi:hypothetical protein